MTFRTLLMAVFSITLLAGAATASEIYTWVDQSGNIHFADRPDASNAVQRLDISSQRTDNAVVQARIEARQSARAAAKEKAAAEAQPEPGKEELREQRMKREESCQAYRDQLDRFMRSQHLYRENEAGERHYLDEEEKLAAHARVRSKIKEHCDS
jgi:hypothetical protein